MTIARAAPSPDPFDAELADLPFQTRWREWMGRVEAAVFASPAPVSRETLSALVGRACILDELIADIRSELRARPYDLVAVAGGWQHRTRLRFAGAVRQALDVRQQAERAPLSHTESLALTAIAYLQPVTRLRLSQLIGRDISRDIIARLKRLDLIGAGPRVAEPGAPLTYVTTRRFLSVFGLASLRDLPDMDALEEAGLLDRGPDYDRAQAPLDAILARGADDTDDLMDKKPDTLSAD